MLEQLCNDSRLEASELGLAAWAYYKERFTIEEARQRFGSIADDSLPYLLSHQIIIEDGGQYIFMAEAKKKYSALEQLIVDFRKKYPGTKPGSDETIKLLKKHKDWKEAAPLLMPALEREIAWREAGLQKGEFRPHPKNLQTWLNQRCWNQSFGKDDPREKEIAEKGSEAYYTYVTKIKEEIGDLPYYLRAEQLMQWLTLDGPFKGLDRRLSEERRKSIFRDAHRALRDVPKEVQDGGGLFNYLVTLCK